ncbi:MAG: glutamate--cysteine ligase [Gammaproteobacteria bacterium]|nr:glutamate--cysteine ligase [Gammaproteobacteria bacterium]
MPAQLERALDALKGHTALRALRRGIEKESLRVTPDGSLSQTPHPRGLGAALTHPHITTDFSEAQLELITDVHESAAACIGELEDIHRFVYRNLPDELMWTASMPCLLGAESDIPVGRYGTSNVGRSKTIYRLGLGHRYGRLMQTISGIHYNFSLPDALWPVVAKSRGERSGNLTGGTMAGQTATATDAYFDLIRNFRRTSWLLLYLFGASPAVCKSFARDQPHHLQSLDEGTLYLPYATSLRMGGLGYQSDAQSSLHVSYNSLADYSASMQEALTKPYPPYEQMGVKVDDEYRQLNAALLQIENEFYGTIRPKRRTHPGERPLAALHARGVEYVEVRCMDLNPFLRVGIDVHAMRFLDIFLLHCLLSASPPDSRTESEEMLANQHSVVETGREPDLHLERNGNAVAMADWATTILSECDAIAETIDEVAGNDDHTYAVELQRQKIAQPALTPSARLLESMRLQRVPFFRFAMSQSAAHKGYFEENPLRAARLLEFERMTEKSIEDQAKIEASDTESFDEYLARYLAINP